MATFLMVNGVCFIEFFNTKYNEKDDETRLLLYSNEEIVSVIPNTFDVVSHDPLVLAFDQNPKKLHDFLLRSKVDHVGFESRKDGLFKESFKIDIKIHVDFDSISYAQDIKYKKPKKISAFTHVYNETKMLNLWIEYYGKLVGHENLYIIDHGSTNDLKYSIRKDVNCISIPRGECDHWNMAKYCAYFQRFLLTQYDWVIHTDCDEFLMFSEDNNILKNLSRYHIGNNLKPCKAYDVIGSSIHDSVLEYDKPILNQRSKMRFNGSFLKTSITSSPVTWAPGFHKCYDEPTEDSNLWLFHLKLIDPIETLNRSKEIWQKLSQTELDKKFFTLEKDEIYQAKNLDSMKQMIDSTLDGCIDIPNWAKTHL